MTSSSRKWEPHLVYKDGQFNSGLVVTDDQDGLIESISKDNSQTSTHQPKAAMLPGLVNGHSHSFQRVIRGRTEFRTSGNKDSFWTWRELMYSAANRLTPEDLYDSSRMAFLEMALSGITAVGEFHYLHHQPDGTPFDDPNVMSKEVVRAARDVGLRITLLRVAYARSGFERSSNPLQSRFIEQQPATYIANVERLISDFPNDPHIQIGVAPHSVRAVPVPYLKEIISFARSSDLVVHMHVAEQAQEVSECIAEYGRSPVALLETEGMLSNRFTAVHAIHVTDKAITALANADAIVCACPTTERNLGDGVVPADSYFKKSVRISLGTDSQAQIDLLEDARELEYHLRLQKAERVVLEEKTGERSALAARLFACATTNGAASIGLSSGSLDAGSPADFFTVDLNDPSLAGSSTNDLLPNIVFASGRSAIRDVVVGGKTIVTDGRHADQDEIVERFQALQKKLWETD